MPATQFFSMLDAMRTLSALEKIEACDLAAITICDHKWYDKVRGRYVDILDAKTFQELPPAQPKPAIDAASDEAKYGMMRMFARRAGLAHG